MNYSKLSREEIVLMVLFTLVGLLFAAVLILAAINHNQGAYRPEPQPTNPERFELSMAVEYPHGCRYDLYAVTPQKRTKVGYIRSHCNYSADLAYIARVVD